MTIVAFPIIASVVSITLFIFLKICGTKWRHRKTMALPLPPGPKGRPIIGNLLEMPHSFEWLTYHRWAKEIGTDILYLNAAGTNIIILDTLHAAEDLLDKRSALYSGRARMPMVTELMGWNFAIGFLDYGETWRHRRRLVNEQFNVVAIKQFRSQFLSSTRKLLLGLLEDPTNVIGNLGHMAADTIFSIAYGLDVEREGRTSLEAAKEANHAMLVAGVPGRFLVDFIPLLKYVPEWVPGAQFQRQATTWKKLTTNMLDMAFNTATAKINKGSTRPSLISRLLEKKNGGTNPSLYTHEHIKSAAGSMYTAGSDTTVSALASCILGLVCNPRVVERAQKELDSVLGPDHLPDFSDEESLPYITAIVKETLRWRDVAPMAIPHRLTSDDVYRGYRLPKDSLVFGNSWAMLHNKEVYPDPFTFNPDRFIKDGRFDKSIPDPELTCWGFGRRVCPGRHMAYSAVWIAVASLLTVFDIKKAVDEKGNTIEPRDEAKSSLVWMPEPYECSITPRSEAWRTILQSDTSFADM